MSSSLWPLRGAGWCGECCIGGGEMRFVALSFFEINTNTKEGIIIDVILANNNTKKKCDSLTYSKHNN